MRKNAGILRAEARIELRGGGTERLLNACAEAGLPLRDISFSENSCLHATLRQSDLQRMEKTAALFQCEMRTLELWGGGVKRLRARSRLAAFAAVCAVLLALSSLFIWDFEVKGNERLSKGEILRALSDCGVSEGCFWPAADAERVRGEMLLRCGDLAWMTLNVRGSRATVLVRQGSARRGGTDACERHDGQPDGTDALRARRRQSHGGDMAGARDLSLAGNAAKRTEKRPAADRRDPLGKKQDRSCHKQ